MGARLNIADKFLSAHREHPAEEAYVTGTFDNWQKTVKLEKSDGVFQKTVDIAHPSHKIYYKVRGRKPGVVPFLRVFGSSMAVSLAELHDCTPGLVKHGFAAPSVCLRECVRHGHNGLPGRSVSACCIQL